MKHKTKMLFLPSNYASIVHCNKSDYDVYVGRPSKWGNPFTHIQDGKTLAKYIVNTRKEAVESYYTWITEGDGKYLLEDLHELKGKILGCWCGNFPDWKPDDELKCHGQVLQQLLKLKDV
jgi:hypothetical protein